MGAGRRAPGLRPPWRPGDGALKADVSAGRGPLPPAVWRSGWESLRTAGPDSPNPDPKAAGRRRGRPDSPGPSWLGPASSPPPSPLPNSQSSNPSSLWARFLVLYIHTLCIYTDTFISENDLRGTITGGPVVPRRKQEPRVRACLRARSGVTECSDPRPAPALDGLHSSSHGFLSISLPILHIKQLRLRCV